MEEKKVRPNVIPQQSWQSSLFRKYVAYQKNRTDRNMPVSEQRAAIEKAGRTMPVPRKVQVQPLTVDGIPVEWVVPPFVHPKRVILYMHGGGYAIGSLDSHRAFVARLALTSHTRVLNVGYRLAPEHPYPAAIDDMLTAYNWLLNNGYDSKHIVFAGDSAGAGLALVVMLALRDAEKPLPAAGVLLSPFTDLTASGTSVKTRADADPMNKPEDIAIVQHYVGDMDPAHPMLSPLFADLHGLPFLYIQVGYDEIMLSDSTRFAEKAEQAGVRVELEIWEGMWHMWQFFAPYMPESNNALKNIAGVISMIG